MGDGSLIEANASLYSLVEKGVESQKNIVNENQHKRTKDFRGIKISNKTHISSSDPEATLAGKIGQPKGLRYKAHNLADADSRIILDTHITTGARPEGNVFIKRVEHTKNSFSLEIKEVIADRGYGYGENLQYFSEQNIKTSIPNFHQDCGAHIDDNGFVYDEERDVYLCPMKQELSPYQKIYIKGLKKYRISRLICKKCSLKEDCLGPRKKNKVLNVSVYKKYQDQVRQQELTDDFRKAMRERMWKIEGLFAEAKRFHGLKRARYRGKAKMQMQAYMVATVQNLKRLISSFFKQFFAFSKYFEGKNKFLLSKNIPEHFLLFT